MRHEIDILDDEYCTPAQAAEIRRMKAELPLWQEMELLPPSDAVTNDATAHATQALDGLETTIDTHLVSIPQSAPSNAPSGFFDSITLNAIRDTPYDPDYEKWLADVEKHRSINGTQGQESEQ